MSSQTTLSSGLGVTIRDVGMRFDAGRGGVEALAGCNLEIAAGSFTVVIGPEWMRQEHPPAADRRAAPADGGTCQGRRA